MAEDASLILGEFSRLLDERYRVSMPTELIGSLTAEDAECVLAKERPGCLSLWNRASWDQELQAGMGIVTGKLQAGRLAGRMGEVQLLGRLLSTRHRDVRIAGRGRLLVPEGFREFLGVEPGSEVIVVGAAVCVELWRPAAWLSYLQRRIPKFRRLMEKLSG